MSRPTDGHRRTSKLFPLFRMEGGRYALDAHKMAEMLPLSRPKCIPEASEWVTGMLSHCGTLVPVLDLCTTAFGRTALARTSTCIVLVEYRACQKRESVRLGLILEQAIDILRREPSALHDYGLDNGGARYLSPVYEGPWGLVQRVQVETLLPDEMHALLFPLERGEEMA